MNINKRLFHLVIVGLLLTSLGSCDLLFDSSDSNDRMRVNNNVEELNRQIQIINEPIVLDSVAGKTVSGNQALGNKDDFHHVANIASPTIDGHTLSATSVEIHANIAYVSYHLNDSAYGGAIDIINLREDLAEYSSRVIFEDTDINALELEENGQKLWYTGGRDVSATNYQDEMPEHKGAVVGEVRINGRDQFVDGSRKETPLPSYSGNALVEWSQEVYVASGATGGGYFQLDKANLDIQESVNTDSAKYVDRYQGGIVGLSLKNGTTANFDMMSFNSGNTDDYDTGLEILPTDGKNVIEHHAAVTYAALGNKGVKGYNFDGGSSPLVYEYNPSGSGVMDVANGVTVDGKYVYIAHGIDGLYITTHPRSGNHDPEAAYSWKGDNADASTNFVKTNGKYVIVANGIDGINILRKNSANNE